MEPITKQGLNETGRDRDRDRDRGVASVEAAEGAKDMEYEGNKASTTHSTLY